MNPDPTQIPLNVTSPWIWDLVPCAHMTKKWTGPFGMRVGLWVPLGTKVRLLSLDAL